MYYILGVDVDVTAVVVGDVVAGVDVVMVVLWVEAAIHNSCTTQ